MVGGALVRSLQKLALVLNKLNHPELALGYAHAATCIDTGARKARYQAAVACMALACPGAALFYIQGVRLFSHLRCAVE